MILNRPRIIPFNPNSEDITLGGEPLFGSSLPPIRPTVAIDSAPIREQGTSVVSGSENDDGSDITAMFNRLYQPERKYLDMMDQMIANAPVRNKPGKLRQIFGAIAQGLGGGPEGRQEILYRPYYNQMADWEAKFKPIETAAGIERQNNANMRMVANQIVSQELGNRRLEESIRRNNVLGDQGNRRLDLTAGRNEVLEDQGNRRIDQAQQRIDLATELANGGTIKVDDNGQAWINRRDGTIDKVDDMSFLSWAKKESIKTANAKSVKSTATGASARDRVKEVVVDDPDHPGVKITGTLNLDTNTFTPATTTTSSGAKTRVTPTVRESAAETSKTVVNRAQEVKNSNPRWNKYITIKGNTVAITRPGIFSGPSKEEYDQMYQQVFGTKPPVIETGKTIAPGTKTPEGSKVTLPAGVPPPRSGHIKVQAPDGRYGDYPRDKVSQLPKGWKVVSD